MKKIVIVILLLSSCGNYKKSIHNTKINNANEYQVYKIDSVGSYYLIYAKKQYKDTLYKIISSKYFNHTKNYEKIKAQKKYVFLLQTAIPDIKLRGQTIPSHNPYVRCYTFANSTQICLEDYVYDLYFANNVKGLFIEKSDYK